jgi:hypothetical protein|tara:strand:- start:33022 stop:33270 length:249 start_codon:yes stop_codon:yes gene_type:complete
MVISTDRIPHLPDGSKSWCKNKGVSVRDRRNGRKRGSPCESGGFWPAPRQAELVVIGDAHFLSTIQVTSKLRIRRNRDQTKS